MDPIDWRALRDCSALRASSLTFVRDRLRAAALRRPSPPLRGGSSNSRPALLKSRVREPSPTGDQKNARTMRAFFCSLARPERFELPTPWFVARYSIQLSYGRVIQAAQSGARYAARAPFTKEPRILGADRGSVQTRSPPAAAVNAKSGLAVDRQLTIERYLPNA
jgi:hypothetical protein